MLGLILATTVADYATASAATVALTAMALGAVKLLRRPPAPRGPSTEARLASLDTKVDSIAEGVSELRGTVRMLPCVKDVTRTTCSHR